MAEIYDPRMPAAEDCVLARLLEKWAAGKPEETAVNFDGGESWSWAETLKLTRQVAKGLANLGIQQGDHVLSWQPNGREAVLTWFALNYLGAVYVPLNTAYKGSLLQHVVQISDARLMVCHAGLAPALNDVETGSLSDVVITNGAAELDHLTCHGADVLFGADNDLAEAVEIQPWDSQYIIFTSGTTGPSKAVLSSYIHNFATAPESYTFVDGGDRILVNLPMFHMGGTMFIMLALAHGGSCVVVESFKTEDFWPVIRRHEITFACFLGAMAPFLLKPEPSAADKDHPLRSVVCIPWNEDALALSARFGFEMRTVFNMTETSVPLISTVNPKALGTCGRPRPGVEVRVVDENDCEVAPGVVGELIIRTDRPWSMNHGYYKNPEATARVWRNGWFHTGDGFRYDENGEFYFVDRIKDAIRRRGENISSFEVESEVSLFGDVAEVAAIPVPSEFGEDEVMIVVAPPPGQTLDPMALFQFLEPRMAHFMLPRYIRTMETLPMTPTQKVQKNLLRDDGITPDTWDREDHGIRVRRKSL